MTRRMKTGKWKKIEQARLLLGLDDEASIEEIKSAYRKLSKRHHPDTAEHKSGNVQAPAMHDITDAYETLMQHCLNYRVPLEPDKHPNPDNDEDWWYNRFGQDPIWGKTDT